MTNTSNPRRPWNETPESLERELFVLHFYMECTGASWDYKKLDPKVDYIDYVTSACGEPISCIEIRTSPRFPSKTFDKQKFFQINDDKIRHGVEYGEKYGIPFYLIAACRDGAVFVWQISRFEYEMFDRNDSFGRNDRGQDYDRGLGIQLPMKLSERLDRCIPMDKWIKLGGVEGKLDGLDKDKN